jgi:hypothetical protein
MEFIMKTVTSVKASTRNTTDNKGYTMRIIDGIVKNMLKNAKTFDKFNNAFSDLQEDTFYTDFLVFFNTGDEIGTDFNPNNWYIILENTKRGNMKIYDVTEEINSLPLE